MRGTYAIFAAVLISAVCATSAWGAPNVVLVQTDDQSMNTLGVMQKTKALIGDQGMVFDRHYVSFSICCPSRASTLTGQYAHNHGVRSNFPPNGSYSALDHQRTLPVWLQRAGYVTGHVGKYLNFYSAISGIPPGWNEWYTAIDPFTYRYTDYVLNENGKLKFYGRREQDYQTDVYTRKAVDFIRRRAGESRPFFLAVDYMAAHGEFGIRPGQRTPTGPPRPAKRHAGAKATEPLPMPPNFNEADVSDKPSHVQDDPPASADAIAKMTSEHRLRLESLLSVDEGVERIVETLDDEGVLENTVVIFMSDNGWMTGEHRYTRGKLRIYEPSTRIPLMVRGPGVATGTTAALTSNIDIAPTVAELAGATPDLTVDGRSLAPVLEDPGFTWDRDLLHEYFPTRGGQYLGEGDDPGFTAIRTEDGRVLAEHDTGESELYDLTSDPFQLTSLHADPARAAEKAALSARLAQLRGCAGATCN